MLRIWIFLKLTPLDFLSNLLCPPLNPQQRGGVYFVFWKSPIFQEPNHITALLEVASLAVWSFCSHNDIISLTKSKTLTYLHHFSACQKHSVPRNNFRAFCWVTQNFVFPTPKCPLLLILTAINEGPAFLAKHLQRSLCDWQSPPKASRGCKKSLSSWGLQNFPWFPISRYSDFNSKAR